MMGMVGRWIVIVGTERQVAVGTPHYGSYDDSVGIRAMDLAGRFGHDRMVRAVKLRAGWVPEFTSVPTPDQPEPEHVG